VACAVKYLPNEMAEVMVAALIGVSVGAPGNWAA
jgi:hypothetical protein